MRIKLPDYLSPGIILFAVFILGVAFKGYAESTLNPRDVAFVGSNTGKNGGFDSIVFPAVPSDSTTDRSLGGSEAVIPNTGTGDGVARGEHLPPLNDISNNRQEGNNAAPSSLVLYNDIVSSPTVAFSTSTLSGNEGTTVDLTVKLVEANNTAVNVDVALLGSSGSADASDFEGRYVTHNVSFTASDSSGTTRNIQLRLKNDGNYEGTEKAVFQLQNQSSGTIIEPNIANLTIRDSDAPKVVINEVLPDPGDREINNDGDIQDAEFVEIVNNETSAIDISNWSISDKDGTRFTFPSGTIITGNRAVVVFGGRAPSGSFGGAKIFTSNGLSLHNSDETVMLKDEQGNEIDHITYSSSKAGISLNRDPDGTGSMFTDHNNISGAKGNFSPGTKVDGSPFGAKHSIGFRGSEGWRMISSPVQGATLNDFFDNFWMQGIPDSDNPNGSPTVYSWNESVGSFSTPTSMSDELQAGQGYLVYFFKDDNQGSPGVQGGFPKIINTDKNENDNTVTFTVSSTDADGSNSLTGNEGFNLLGNPFDTDISVDKVLEKIRAALQNRNSNYDVNSQIYVWDYSEDSGNGGYRTLDEGTNATIAPFQAFWIRVENVENSSSFTVTTTALNRNNLAVNRGTEFYKQINESAFKFDLELHGDQYYDTYSVDFTDQGSTDLNSHDAFKLLSLNANSINLYSTLQNNKLQKKVLPRNLESTVELPLAFNASGRKSLTFKWDNIESIPSDWKVMLVDKQMNRKIDLSSSKEYRFNASQDQSKLKTPGERQDTLLNKQKETDNNTRFSLSIQPKPKQTSSNDLPESVKLNPNYPNPFNPTTKVSYEVTVKSKVTLTIWNMIGQKVATLVDGVVDAGKHEETWNASQMPSGIYIARFQINGRVFTRKMTLIK
ncbi:MAG TPA: lamin tail domain-containing protein [Balneolaceae bacterium]|nr:lamin tail domain-containing protein [Balneolaceae bacterium]